MANGPKRFDETTTSTSALLKDSTEYIGIAQSGTSKKILTSDLMTKSNVGLDNVDNTADADKPVSTATQEALNLKANSTDVTDALNSKADQATTYTKTEVNDIADEKIAITDIYNGLDSTSTDVPLSANKGRELNESVKTNATNIASNTTNLSSEVLRAKSAESTNATNISTNATNITKKVNTADIVDTLDSTAIDKPLSANMGSVISQKLTEIENSIQTRIYGFDYDEATGDVTRLEDAVGLTIGSPDGTSAITSDFDSIYPWSDIRHVKVEDDGTIIEQSDDDYATSDGEIMTYIPQFYYKDDRKNGHRYCYISNTKFADYKKAWQDKEYGLIGSFGASYDTDYHSKYGEALKVNTSYTSFLTGFYAKGDGKWSMYDANMMHNLFLLTCIEGGSTNHKGMYGRGINSGMPYSDSDIYKIVTATTDANTVILDSLGQSFYVGMLVQIGTSYANNSIASDRYITDISDDGTYLTITVDGDSFSTTVGNTIATWAQPVPQSQYETMGDGSGYILQFDSENRSHACYRGIWDLWGNMWQLNAGFMRYDGQYYGCCDKTKYNITDPRNAEGWSDLGIGGYADNGYQQIRESIAIDGGSIDVPVAWGSVASSETFYSAYLYNFISDFAGARVLPLGGYWRHGSSVSPVCSFGDYSPSNTYVVVGSRLIR